MQKQGLEVMVAGQLTSKEIKTKTVEMFVAFFSQVGNTLQAELIDRLCRKNVCSMVAAWSKVGVSDTHTRVVVLRMGQKEV